MPAFADAPTAFTRAYEKATNTHDITKLAGVDQFPHRSCRS